MASDTKERTAKERVLWAVGLAAVIFYALIPVAWIVSLSLKPSSQLTDGQLLPRSTTLENYRAIFEDSQFPSALRNSIGIVTALNPYIGYANATEVAAEAHRSNRGVAEIVLERKLMSPEQLADVLRPEVLTKPQMIAPLAA